MSIRARINPRVLDQRVRFERLAEPATRSASGEPAAAWGHLCTCWAKVDGGKASGPEPYVGDQTLSVRDYVVWIRAEVFTQFRIRVADRLLWQRQGGDDVVLNVADIPDQGLRGRLIAVFCSDGRTQG
jgi:head-tail adaptor